MPVSFPCPGTIRIRCAMRCGIATCHCPGGHDALLVIAAAASPPGTPRHIICLRYAVAQSPPRGPPRPGRAGPTSDLTAAPPGRLTASRTSPLATTRRRRPSFVARRPGLSIRHPPPWATPLRPVRPAAALSPVPGGPSRPPRAALLAAPCAGRCPPPPFVGRVHHRWPPPRDAGVPWFAADASSRRPLAARRSTSPSPPPPQHQHLHRGPASLSVRVPPPLV